MVRKLNLFAIITTLICMALPANAGKNKHLNLYSPEVREMKAASTNDLLKAYLDRSSFRHKTLSENMANVNTPKYKANEVPEVEGYDDLLGKGKKVRKLSMARTNQKHIIGKDGQDGHFVSEKLKDPYEIKPNGNNVSVAQQMTKLSQNQQDYNAAVKSYATTNGLVSAVLGK